MTNEEFAAAQAKIIASYRKHPRVVIAFQGPNAVCRDFDDACVAAAENSAQDFDPRTNPVEALELFEASLEGILSY